MKKNNMKLGFTIIELLVVVAIIVILATIVTLGLSSARKDANRANATGTIRNVMPEFSLCANDNLNPSTPVAGTAICTPHVVPWPALTGGWAYGTGANAPTGTVAAGNYIFFLVKDGETTITCSFAETSCN